MLHLAHSWQIAAIRSPFHLNWDLKVFTDIISSFHRKYLYFWKLVAFSEFWEQYTGFFTTAIFLDTITDITTRKEFIGPETHCFFSIKILPNNLWQFDLITFEVCIMLSDQGIFQKQIQSFPVIFSKLWPQKNILRTLI